MKHPEGNADELKQKFWTKLADSPFVMLLLDGDPHTAAPMTVQLDKDAHGSIWFFTSKTGDYAKLGKVTATFSSKGHDLFSHFHGTLTPETSKERLDDMYNNFVEAWFPGGKDDPNLLFLRMDLGEASIWDSDLGLMTTAKMMLGMDVREDAQGYKVQTTL